MITTNGNHEASTINYYAQFALPGDQQSFGLDSTVKRQRDSPGATASGWGRTPRP